MFTYGSYLGLQGWNTSTKAVACQVEVLICPAALSDSLRALLLASLLRSAARSFRHLELHLARRLLLGSTSESELLALLALLGLLVEGLHACFRLRVALLRPRRFSGVLRCLFRLPQRT